MIPPDEFPVASIFNFQCIVLSLIDHRNRWSLPFAFRHERTQ